MANEAYRSCCVVALDGSTLRTHIYPCPLFFFAIVIVCVRARLRPKLRPVRMSNERRMVPLLFFFFFEDSSSSNA